MFITAESLIDKHLAYNGMDCLATSLVHDAVYPQLDALDRYTYEREMALMGPVFDMGMRGIKVNQGLRSKLTAMYRAEQQLMLSRINTLAGVIWNKPLNPNSSQQKVAIMYEEGLGLKKVWKMDKGRRRLSSDRETLEKLAEQRWEAELLIKHILHYMDIKKYLEVLTIGIDGDGRIRTAYNIGGTDTGRFSSNTNPENTGSNLQNITDKMREMYEADEGMVMAYIDLEQAESRAVGYIAHDEAYIAACESGDLHTTVSKMVWPNLGWTGDLSHDRYQIAEQPFYRDFSYRDTSKRKGHATNYYGSAWQLSKILRIPQDTVRDFQLRYFTAFPGIPAWHRTTEQMLFDSGEIITALGRRRRFYGRAGDASTLRAAIAHEPQSTVGDILNIAMYQVWQAERRVAPRERITLHAQLHDAILVQGPADRVDTWLPRVRKSMEVPVRYPAGVMIIPTSAEVGWNWAHVKYKKQTASRKPRWPLKLHLTVSTKKNWQVTISSGAIA